MTFHRLSYTVLGMSSSQLTNSYFFRGVGIPPARCLYSSMYFYISMIIYDNLCIYIYIMYVEPVSTIYPSLIKHGLLENPPRIDLRFSHLKPSIYTGFAIAYTARFDCRFGYFSIVSSIAEGDGT